MGWSLNAVTDYTSIIEDFKTSLENGNIESKDLSADMVAQLKIMNFHFNIINEEHIKPEDIVGD